MRLAASGAGPCWKPTGLFADPRGKTLAEEAFFIDPAACGSDLWAIPLRASKEGIPWLVGIALLAGPRQDGPYAMVLASRLAEQLLDSGNWQPMRVAQEDER